MLIIIIDGILVKKKPNMYSGGYYLSDGEPIKDHPYSGVFAFSH